ncbi:MAG: hypothetical protein R6W70_10395 [bacterium]
MKYGKYLFFLIFCLFFSSCFEPPQNEMPSYDYKNETGNLYHEYETVDVGTQDAEMYEKWDVPTFSFYGTINDSQTPFESIEMGEGTLVYNSEDVDEAYGEFTWAVKKHIQTSAGHKIPIIQVFFANTFDSESYTAFILQITGSSVVKNEVHFLGLDKLYKVEITSSEGVFSEICFLEEPPRGQAGGIVYFLEHSSKVGEILSVKGHAMMDAMDPVDCKDM